jgi:hypothetical protein
MGFRRFVGFFRRVQIGSRVQEVQVGSGCAISGNRGEPRESEPPEPLEPHEPIEPKRSFIPQRLDRIDPAGPSGWRPRGHECHGAIMLALWVYFRDQGSGIRNQGSDKIFE